MRINVGVGVGGASWTRIGACRTAWQWQPTRTVHDPNPPITLEDEPVIPPDTGLVLRMSMGMGL